MNAERISPNRSRLPLLAEAQSAPTWNLPVSGGPLEENDLEDLVRHFPAITLEEMDAVALLDRLDYKYLMTLEQMRTALVALLADYRVLSVRGERLNHYRSLYFDTCDFALFHAHVNGRAERFKVRCREYLDSQESYLEVKQRTRKERTIKQRLACANPAWRLTPELNHWIRDVRPDACQTLEPKLWNTFTRITLVSCNARERVTLDYNLAFHLEKRTAHLDGLAIAEVKLERGPRESAFATRMRALGIHPRSFSKYAFGTALLVDQVKKNLLKPQLHLVEKLTKGPLRIECHA